MAPHPLIERLLSTAGGRIVRPETAEAWESEPGDAVLFFAGDPVRFPEALDVAVVLPELRAACAGGWRIGVVPRDVEDALARRHGVLRWPSLVFLRGGLQLGIVSGMKDWADYVNEIGQVLAATPTRRSALTIPLVSADGASCH